jgi:UPF0755 protein
MQDDIYSGRSGQAQNPADTFRDDEFRNAFGEGDDLKRAFGEEAPAPAPTPEPQQIKEAPVKKGRPKRKGKYGLLGIPHILSTAVWIGLIVLIGVTAGRMIWLCATDVLAFGREPITATVVVEKDDNIESIAAKLQEAGLIRFTGLFELYADLSHAEEEIRPGTYIFNNPEKDEEKVVYDYMALVSVMSPSSKHAVVEDLRIPEGYTCSQIFKLLEEKNVCTTEELEEAAMNGDLGEYWFLEGVKRDNKYCLEGFLFPDTYDFYEHDEPERVLKKMLNTFDTRFTDSMRQELVNLNNMMEDKLRGNGYGKSYIEEHKFTVREVVIVASMIEKETANNAESFIVSSVIYNRLTNPGEYPFLNIDATLVYALGGRNELTAQDKEIDSPYNTYREKGLIPGPIASPSQNSLVAALQPEDTKYYYYAYNPATEEHKFSKTYKEHQDFLASLRG